MGVLSSLLPGLRDVRAPLAAGYIFLFDLWLLFGTSLPEENEATGVVESIYRLEGFVSSIGVAVAVSFVAFLVGVFFQAADHRLLELEWRVETAVRRHPPKRRAEDIYPNFLRSQVDVLVRSFSLESNQVVTALRETVQSYGFEYVEKPDEEGDFYLVEADDGSVVFPGVFLPDELLALDRVGVITQLMINREMNTLYGEFDRQKSESQFRAAIFLPLVFLIVIVAGLEHWLWLLLLLAPCYLLVEARLLNQRAERQLTSVLSSRQMQSQLLRDLRESLQKAQSSRR